MTAGIAAPRPAAVRDERLRDAGRDHRQARRALRADAVERRHDAAHGPEQSDEGRRARRRREERQVALQRRHLEPGGPAHRPMHGLQPLGAADPRHRRRSPDPCRRASRRSPRRRRSRAGRGGSHGACVPRVHHRGSPALPEHFTKPSVCRRTRRSCHHFSTIVPMTRPRTRAVRQARTWRRSGVPDHSKTPEVKESAVANEAPLRLLRSYVAARRAVNVLPGIFAALHAVSTLAGALTHPRRPRITNA